MTKDFCVKDQNFIMSKYSKYNIRPAGDSSNSDSSDSDGFSLTDYNKKPKKVFSHFKNKVVDDENEPNVENTKFMEEQAALQTKRDLEFEVMKACMCGKNEVVENYVKAGNDVNEFLHSGWTLLLYAASSIQLEIIKLLLDLGADPNIHKDGYTPLMSLCNSLKEDEEDKAITCLHLLLEANADPNATSKNRENALMVSVKLRSEKFVEELIKVTSNINLTDSDGSSVMYFAVFYNRIDIVKLLLKHGADFTIRNRNGSTPYDCANMKQYNEIAEILKTNAIDDMNYVEVMNTTKWEHLFPDICDVDENKVTHEISLILYGMGLEKYQYLFKGMNLKKFLTLTDEDLKQLGMDLSIHRKRFLDDIYRLHSRQWNPNSLGFRKIKGYYKIFDGVLTLGNLVKKFCLIGSSFSYIRQSVVNKESKDLLLTSLQRKQYEQELDKAEKTMISLKNELELFKKVAEKIELQNRDSYPPTYISKKKKSVNWPVIIACMTILGLCLFKTQYVQRLLPTNNVKLMKISEIGIPL